jgi:hypothetical protein
MCDIKIEDYKKTLYDEFKFTQIVDDKKTLNCSFLDGTILMIPNYKERQRPWIVKAVTEWKRGNRTIVVITPLANKSKYFQNLVANSAEIRVITDYLVYNSCHRVTKPMIIAIYKQKEKKVIHDTIYFN